MCLTLFCDNNTLIGNADLFGISEHQRCRFPVPSLLHPVYWRAIRERINRPIVPQVMGGKMIDPQLLTQEPDSIIETIAGDAPALVSHKERSGAPTSSLYLAEIRFSSTAGMLLYPMLLRLMSLLTID